MYYRETTESALLSRAMYEITLAYGGTVSISSLFIATWDQVGYDPNGFDKVLTSWLIMNCYLIFSKGYTMYNYYYMLLNTFMAA